jgi:hypothetical protein
MARFTLGPIAAPLVAKLGLARQLGAGRTPDAARACGGDTRARLWRARAPENFVRFSTASSLTDLHTAAKRLQQLLEAA